MNLKKSDKIIAIVGVLILVVAVIGIVLYQSGEEDTGINGEPEVKYYDFNILTEEKTEPVINESFTIRDRLFGDDSVVTEINISGVAIKDINFYVDFMDRNSGLLGFGKILTFLGADTLTVTIMDEEENELLPPTSIKGSGNVTYQEFINNVLTIDTITARNEEEAKSMLTENHTNIPKAEENYIVKVSLDEKERMLLRPLAWLREKIFGRDTFDLMVSYNYEEYSIEDMEIDDDNDDMPESGIEDDNKRETAPFAPTAYPGKH